MLADGAASLNYLWGADRNGGSGMTTCAHGTDGDVTLALTVSSASVSADGVYASGFTVVNRVHHNYQQLFINGAQVGSDYTKFAGSLCDNFIYLMARNTAGVAGGFSAGTMGLWYAGGGLTAGEISDFNDAVAAYFA
jgi:hypothetical protein